MCRVSRLCRRHVRGHSAWSHDPPVLLCARSLLLHYCTAAPRRWCTPPRTGVGKLEAADCMPVCLIQGTQPPGCILPRGSRSLCSTLYRHENVAPVAQVREFLAGACCTRACCSCWTWHCPRCGGTQVRGVHRGHSGRQARRAAVRRVIPQHLARTCFVSPDLLTLGATAASVFSCCVCFCPFPLALCPCAMCACRSLLERYVLLQPVFPYLDPPSVQKNMFLRPPCSTLDTLSPHTGHALSSILPHARQNMCFRGIRRP